MRWNASAIHTSRRPIRRAAAVLAACALSLTALVAVAPAASAEVTGSQLQLSSSNDDYRSASAYDSTHNQYLVTWMDESASNDVLTGQLLGASGTPIGSAFAIETYAGTGQGSPGIVYDAADDQFLVTFVHNSDVLAQRIASDGTLVGSQITVSSRTYSSTDYLTEVVWSPEAGSYLVVWHGYNSVVGGDSVRGRLLAADGTLGGTSDFTISMVDTSQVAAAYNTVDHEFLVAWTQENNVSTTDIGVWGRRVATDGTTLGASSFQISHTTVSDAYRPRIAFDPDSDRYLVVWIDPTLDQGGVCGTWAFGAYEVFGQLVAADGAMSGSTFQVSDRARHDIGMGVLDEPRCDAGATGPAVAYDPGTDRYLVGFSESATRWSRWMDSEIYGDYVTSAGDLVGTRDFQISNMGAWRTSWTSGLRPTVVSNTSDDEFLVTWFGSTSQGSLTEDDYNIWGTRVSGTEPSSVPSDTTAPQTAIKLYTPGWWPYAQSDAGPFYKPVLVAVNAFDGLTGSGIAQIRCVVDPTSPPTAFADLPDAPCAPVTIDTDGQYTIYAASIDQSGNASDVVSRTVLVTIDSVGPTVTPSVSPSSTLVLNQTGASASANATDSLSGVSTSDCDAIDTSALGQHSVQCWAYDMAGNYGTSSTTYLVGYKTIFGSPSDGASYAAGKSVSIDVQLGDYNDTLISTADALAMAKAGRVSVSMSGAVTLASTPMKYSRSTGNFSYRLRIPRNATTGTATITVTTSYAGTTLTAATTRTINVTGLLGAQAPETAPAETPTTTPSAGLPTAPSSPTPPAEGAEIQQPAPGAPSTESAQPSTPPEDPAKAPKGVHLR